MSTQNDGVGSQEEHQPDAPGKVLGGLIPDLSGLMTASSKIKGPYSLLALVLGIIGIIVVSLGPAEIAPSVLLLTAMLLVFTPVVVAVVMFLENRRSSSPSLSSPSTTAVPQTPNHAHEAAPRIEDPDLLAGPPRGMPGILLDTSHGQKKWPWNPTDYQGSIFSLMEPAFPPMVGLPVARWCVREIRETKYFTLKNLEHWQGLILAIPLRCQLTMDTQEAVEQWVHDGGNMLLLGYELGDRHHLSNLNDLARRFGLQFNTDIIAPREWPTPENGVRRPYDARVAFTVKSQHPVVESVKVLCLTNTCTISAEPGANVILSVEDHPIVRPIRESVADKYEDHRWLNVPADSLQYESLPGVSWLGVIVEAPPSLTRKGRVIGIGTWRFGGKSYQFPEGCDNAVFLKNLLEWIGTKHD